jgi:hypothetical protein
LTQSYYGHSEEEEEAEFSNGYRKWFVPFTVRHFTQDFSVGDPRIVLSRSTNSTYRFILTVYFTTAANNIFRLLLATKMSLPFLYSLIT